MSLDTYANLQTTIQTWLDRADISALVPDCIVLAEAYFQRNLRVRQMETATAPFLTTLGIAALPTDFLGVKALRRLGSPVTTLAPLEADEFDGLYGTGRTGPSRHYLIAGSNIEIGPADDATQMKLRYYQKIPQLSVSNPTNWLLTAYPDLYLFGALTEAELTSKDGTSAMGWKGRRDDVCNDIQMSEAFRYRASPQVRVQGITP